MNGITAGLQDVDYIGDGVYVGHDGYHVWLRTPRENGIHEIALDQRAFDALVHYRERLMQEAPDAAGRDGE
jgi:hypothetical protein